MGKGISGRTFSKEHSRKGVLEKGVLEKGVIEKGVIEKSDLKRASWEKHFGKGSWEGQEFTRALPDQPKSFRNLVHRESRDAYCTGSAVFKASFSPWLLLNGPLSITRQPSS